ncbi:MAG: lipid-A-disaccharide synthase [Nitrospirae bacterium]|nr:MAG: lipid-A-disaccharide synthase [Nitrospirota bacterium]
MNKEVFISAGEPSGELYGAHLVRALRSVDPDIRVSGVGGEKMRAEGVRLLGEITGTFGLVEAVSSLKHLRDTMRSITSYLREERPSVVVLIDFPDFNFKVAKKAKAQGIPVLYYVSPQIWAWRSKRIHTMKKLCDRVAVILPFEEEIYRREGIPVEFVGHPIMEDVEQIKGSKEFLREEMGLSPERGVLALLPGSRESELKRMLPLYRQVLSLFKERYQAYQYILPLAEGVDEKRFNPELSGLENEGVRIIRGNASKAMYVSDFGLITSGTATLQAALIGLPMVVVYKVFPLTYLIGRLIVDVKHISLVNILAGEGVVRELIQWDATAENIMKELDRLILDDHYRRYMLGVFDKIRQTYEGRNPSLRVARIIKELMEEGR